MRSDDGAGYRAAELIARRLPKIDSLSTHELKPEHAELITKYTTLIFIDASDSCTEVEQLLLNINDGTRVNNYHSLSPQGLLNLSKTLYNYTPDTSYLITIPAQNFEFGEKFSELTQNFIEKSVELIRKLVNYS